VKLTFPLVLFLVFLVLKLTNVIAWSWWWVTAPIWIPFAVWAVCMLIVIVIEAFETPEEKAARRARESLSRMARMLGKR
jgi:hypothetical protein